jgi:predicted porin
MNKKLIAVAIAAAVAAPAAMANNTTLYGKAHMSINHSDVNNADQWNVSNHSSRLGIKGSEDLGNGMKAIFKYEMSYSGLDSSTAIGSARNSYIGLAGDFGTFLVGRHDTPAKVAFYAAGNERLGDSIIDLNSHFGFEELRTNNAIAYISPNFSGFKVAAALVPGEGSNGNDGIADGYSIGLMYSGGGLKAGLGYTSADDFAGVSTDADLLNVGASYTMNNFSIGAQWQDVEVGTVEKESWALTGTAGFGNNKLILMYGESDIDGGNDADTLGVALQHTMSKRTSVYAAFRSGEDGANKTVAKQWIGNGGTSGTGDAYGIGMIHNF